MKLLWRILFSTLLLTQTPISLAQVEASLDRSQISLGETVQLSLLHHGSLAGDPDLTPLRHDFDIIGSNRGTSLQIINGSMSEQTQVQLTLAPRHAGTLSIPALLWGSDHSQPLALTVNAQRSAQGQATPSQPSAASPSSPFITETLDQSTGYVQSSILLTVHIYTDEPLYQASLDLQPTPDMLVQTLGKDQQNEETLQGIPYQVITRHYLLIPQRQGNIALPGPVLDAQVEDKTHPSSFFGNFPFASSMGAMQAVHLQGKTLTFKVLPWPLDAVGHPLLPTSNLSLQLQWQPSNQQVRSGEPLTLHIHMEATGISAASLPDLGSLLKLPAGIKVYPDPVKLDNRLDQDHALGSSDQNLALLASTPGHYEIPALHLSWWDTQQQKIRDTVWPAQSLDILASTSNVGSPSLSALPPRNPSSYNATLQPMRSRSLPSWLWPSTSAALALGWIVHLGFLRRQRNLARKASTATHHDISSITSNLQGQSEHKLFLQACQQNDAIAARQHLLAWGRCMWPSDPPSGLQNLARRLDDPQHQSWVLQLDRACFTGQTWKSDARAETLTLTAHRASDQRRPPILNELYP